MKKKPNEFPDVKSFYYNLRNYFRSRKRIIFDCYPSLRISATSSWPMKFDTPYWKPSWETRFGIVPLLVDGMSAWFSTSDPWKVYLPDIGWGSNYWWVISSSFECLKYEDGWVWFWCIVPTFGSEYSLDNDWENSTQWEYLNLSSLSCWRSYFEYPLFTTDPISANRTWSNLINEASLISGL